MKKGPREPQKLSKIAPPSVPPPDALYDFAQTTVSAGGAKAMDECKRICQKCLMLSFLPLLVYAINII